VDWGSQGSKRGLWSWDDGAGFEKSKVGEGGEKERECVCVNERERTRVCGRVC
jgi:hypothetical protein